MDIMKINLTKKQYWNLVRAVYMADWMTNAICDADTKKDEGIKEIRDDVFSFAKNFGYENFVGYDEKLGKYYATLDMDDEPSVRALIERYDEHTFWEEISERLGDRDFYEKYREEEIAVMEDEDRFIKRMESQIVWEKEFEEHGIQRLNPGVLDEGLRKWHIIKSGLIKNDKKIFFHEREVWWCSVGKNVGFEQNGKGDEFTRPIVVIKRLSLDTCLAVPLTVSKKRKNTFSLGVLKNEEKESFAMAEQIRLVDAKRLKRKIDVVEKKHFEELVNFIKEIIF